MNWRQACGVVAWCVLATVLLSACGGDDSPAPAAPPPVVATVIPDSLTLAAAAASDVAVPTAFSTSAAALAGLSFAWDFGDGSSSTGASPQHTYAKVGDYEVVVKVSNEAGATKQFNTKVSVNNRSHVAGLACTAPVDSGWCWQQPVPTGNQRVDYFFLDALLAWSVGDNGEIFKTIDGGKTWAKQDSGVQTRLYSVRFADANNGWAIGAFGAVLRTVDGGARWQLQAPGLDGYDMRLYVTGPQTVVVSGSGRVRTTRDGGATWRESVFPLAAVASDNTLWGFDGAGHLVRSSDGGQTVTIATTGNVWSGLQLVTKDVVVMSEQIITYDPTLGQYVYKLTIRRSLDSGASWDSFDAQGLPAPYFSYRGVNFIDANVAAITVGSDNYRSADGGRTWAKTIVPAEGLSSIQQLMLDGGAIFRSRYDAAEAYLSEDGGATWRSVNKPDSNYGSWVFKRLGADAWQAMEGGMVSISTDGMRSWARAGGIDPQLTQRSMLATWFFDATRGLGLNALGELQETRNGGRDWTVKIRDLGTSYGPTRFQFVSANHGWLLSTDGKIYRSIDGGEHWSAPLSGRSGVTAFHFVDADHGFALGRDYSDGTLYYGKPVLLATSDGGQSWRNHAELVDGLIDVQFSSVLKGIAVGGNRIVTTEDGGLTWTGRFSGTGSSLRRLALSDADTAWVVGDGGVLLRSANAGATWAKIPLNSGMSFNSIRFLNAQQGWIVGSSGVILATRDGGKTWAVQFSGTQTSFNDVFFVDSRTGWVLGSEGAILATGTGGQ